MTDSGEGSSEQAPLLLPGLVLAGAEGPAEWPREGWRKQVRGHGRDRSTSRGGEGLWTALFHACAGVMCPVPTSGKGREGKGKSTCHRGPCSQAPAPGGRPATISPILRGHVSPEKTRSVPQPGLWMGTLLVNKFLQV